MSAGTGIHVSLITNSAILVDIFALGGVELSVYTDYAL